MATSGADQRMLTLTFDNGPIPGITDRPLDVLAERWIAASFFVVGSRLRAPGGRDLARRAVEEGRAPRLGGPEWLGAAGARRSRRPTVIPRTHPWL
jgi:peptidoglycan/xylan/chitin deacetylase (PgdA/CDA1 family)